MARRDEFTDYPPPPGDWVEEALCGQYLRDKRYEWFPEEDEWNTPEVHRARSTCLRCPVRAECANYAIENRVPHGMWGGLTEMERGFYPSSARGRRKATRPAGRPRCPGCGETNAVVPKGTGYVTCTNCKSTWPAGK